MLHAAIIMFLILSSLVQISPAWAVFPKSPVISSVVWDYNSLKSTAKDSDLWTIAWASDGNQYTIWGDGGGFDGNDMNGRTQWGVGRIEGDADNWHGHNVFGGVNPEAPGWPMQDEEGTGIGYKVDSMTAVDNDLIAIMYNWRNYPNYNSKIIKSSDFGRSWENSDGTSLNGELWDWADKVDGVGFYPPAFIDMGKGYCLSTDGYIYFYSVFEYKALYLGRVEKNSMMVPYAYEYRKSDGTWVADIHSADAVLVNNDISGVNAIYHPYLKRYILTFNSTLGEGRNEEGMHDWMMLEGPTPWGPWYKVGEWHDMIDSTYKFQYRISSKWISNETDFVLVFSGGGPQISNTYDWDALHTINGKFILGSSTPEKAPMSPNELIIR